MFNNVNEDNGDKDFVRVRVSEEDLPNYHYLYAMVDSGNRACNLMSEKAFKKIYKIVIKSKQTYLIKSRFYNVKSIWRYY